MEHMVAPHTSHTKYSLCASPVAVHGDMIVYRLRIKYGHFSSYFIYFRHWRDVGTLSTADSTGEPVRRRPAAAGETRREDRNKSTSPSDKLFRVTPLGYETAGLGAWLTPYTIEN